MFVKLRPKLIFNLNDVSLVKTQTDMGFESIILVFSNGFTLTIDENELLKITECMAKYGEILNLK